MQRISAQKGRETGRAAGQNYRRECLSDGHSLRDFCRIPLSKKILFILSGKQFDKSMET